MTEHWPKISVVIPTYDRRDLLFRAVASAAGQDYPGDVDILVVFDGIEPDDDKREFIQRHGASWTLNQRSKGLPGARNTGIVQSADAQLIAFCDDDDAWHANKLTRQVRAWRVDPDAAMITCAIEVVDVDGGVHPRTIGRSRVMHEELLRSRLAVLHSSTFLARREDLLALGMVDESAPRGHNEDWDLLLRMSRNGHVGHVDVPLVTAPWGRASYFIHDYRSKIESFDWILRQHPDLAADRVAKSRVLGQKAFWLACAEDSAAKSVALESIRLRPSQPRGYLALMVVGHLVKGEWVLQRLNRAGRGL